MRVLAVGDYHEENDMHVLSRLKPAGLQQGVGRGECRR